MRKLTMSLIIALSVIATMFVGAAAPATADTGPDSVTVTDPHPQVMNVTASFVGKAIKNVDCRARAGKREPRRVRPKDPLASCKGLIRVYLTGSIQTPQCPTGFWGSSAQISVSLTQVLKHRAFSRSVANGNVRTWATNVIRDYAEINGSASSTCVRIPPPPVTPTPTPTPTPPPTPVDHKPVVNVMGSPAHLYVGGNAYVWLEASDPDGDAVSVKVTATGGTISGLVPVSVRWDGTPCPTGVSCYRATAWAPAMPGSMTVTATVEANGLAGTPATATWPIVADQF